MSPDSDRSGCSRRQNLVPARGIHPDGFMLRGLADSDAAWLQDSRTIQITTETKQHDNHSGSPQSPRPSSTESSDLIENVHILRMGSVNNSWFGSGIPPFFWQTCLRDCPSTTSWSGLNNCSGSFAKSNDEQSLGGGLSSLNPAKDKKTKKNDDVWTIGTDRWWRPDSSSGRETPGRAQIIM